MLRRRIVDVFGVFIVAYVVYGVAWCAVFVPTGPSDSARVFALRDGIVRNGGRGLERAQAGVRRTRLVGSRCLGEKGFRGTIVTGDTATPALIFGLKANRVGALYSILSKREEEVLDAPAIEADRDAALLPVGAMSDVRAGVFGPPKGANCTGIGGLASPSIVAGNNVVVVKPGRPGSINAPSPIVVAEKATKALESL